MYLINLKLIAEGLNSITDGSSEPKIKNHAQALRVAVDEIQGALEAIVGVLGSSRSRFGKLEVAPEVQGALRPFFVKAGPPNGGEDSIDQCRMTLLGVLGHEVKSTCKL